MSGRRIVHAAKAQARRDTIVCTEGLRRNRCRNPALRGSPLITSAQLARDSPLRHKKSTEAGAEKFAAPHASRATTTVHAAIQPYAGKTPPTLR